MPPTLVEIVSFFPPWAVASLMLGAAAGALGFVLAAPRNLSLPLYLVLGALAALLGQMGSLALEIEPWPLAFGQVHLLAVAASAAVFVAVARLYRL
jgi:hypothetical protein